MKPTQALVASVLLVSCSPSQPSTAPPPPAGPSAVAFTREGDKARVSLSSATVIDGAAPTLSISCDPDGSAMIFVNIVAAPASPPPLQGVYGTFTIDDHAPQRVEMAWGTKGSWTPRLDEQPRVEIQLATELLKANRVRFVGPEGYAPGEPIEWALSGVEPHRDELLSACEQALAQSGGEVESEKGS